MSAAPGEQTSSGAASAARCHQVCIALVAGRRPPELAGPEDAPVLRQLLGLHGLGGLAARAIENDSLSVPEDVAGGIAADWATARWWSSELETECERLGAAAASVPALAAPLLLKGPAVARRYADPTVRTYVDVDLLVPPGQVRAWAGLLGSLGYWAPRSAVAVTARRYQEGVAFERLGPAGELSCDLHACLFVQRGARRLTHEVLAPSCEPSGYTGLVEATPGLQLVVLALHIAHHARRTMRLIWLRDLLELGTPDAVAAARAIAETHGIAWALEAALLAAEVVVGSPRWNARVPAGRLSPLARVNQLDGAGYLRHVALAVELGPLAAMWYFAARVDPRRFSLAGGGFDVDSFRRWVYTVYRRAVATPWLGNGPRRG